MLLVLGLCNFRYEDILPVLERQPRSGKTVLIPNQEGLEALTPQVTIAFFEYLSAKTTWLELQSAFIDWRQRSSSSADGFHSTELTGLFDRPNEFTTET